MERGRSQEDDNGEGTTEGERSREGTIKRGNDREGTILAERFVVESESQIESNPDTGRMDRDQWPKDRRI